MSIRSPASEITGFTENGWVGLSLLHALFALEHNAICDDLKKHNPLWDDERLFQQARLVNAALLAKIHTVEWSTAILPAPITTAGLRTNWYGTLGGLQKLFPPLADRSHRESHSKAKPRSKDGSHEGHEITKDSVMSNSCFSCLRWRAFEREVSLVRPELITRDANDDRARSQAG